jgi:DNA polymerase-4
MQRLHVGAHTVAIKLRYANFRTITRQSSSKTPVDDATALAAIAGSLLDAVTEPGDQFRLLGIHCSKLVEGDAIQAALWSDAGD